MLTMSNESVCWWEKNHVYRLGTAPNATLRRFVCVSATWCDSSSENESKNEMPVIRTEIKSNLIISRFRLNTCNTYLLNSHRCAGVQRTVPNTSKRRGAKSVRTLFNILIYTQNIFLGISINKNEFFVFNESCLVVCVCGGAAYSVSHSLTHYKLKLCILWRFINTRKRIRWCRMRWIL